MVVSNYINIFVNISESEGFGINTDLLETNVINLSVVIGVLVFFGKDILNESLKARKESILKSLQDVDNKLQEATDKLNNAKKQFELAKSKSEEIRSQGLVLASQTSQKLLERIDEDVKRLEETKTATIRFEKEKAITEVCQKVSQLAMENAIQKLSGCLNSDLKKQFIKRSMSLFDSMSEE